MRMLFPARPVCLLLWLIAFAVMTPMAATAETLSTDTATAKPFTSMAVVPDDQAACRAPRPPIDLAPTAYVRNGYRAILRIMAAELWQETGFCECYLTQIPWDNVVARSGVFKTSSDERRPFDVSTLRLRADALLAKRDEACTE
jgi:hypothetical protein